MKRIATLVAVLSLLTFSFGPALAATKSAPAVENSGAKILCPTCAEPFSGVQLPIGVGP